jgi:cellulose synthase/poly-beta-1,6-N-acetylglucosamine synthase-like glycosyltransferase
MAVSRGCRRVGSNAPARDRSQGVVDPATEPVEIWESPGFVFLHRHSNRGFKGGNLREVSAYLRNRGIELMYLLDADWHPQADCLERALEVLEADDRAAFVQTKRLTFKHDLGLFQLYVSLSEEGCYYVDFEGRQVLHHPTLFSGCCALLRLDAVESVGGFAFGHLTEDLDVSNRLWIAGWKGIYYGDVVNYGEVPFTYDDFRRQQERWACGTARCMRDYFLPILQSKRLGWLEKLCALRQNAYFATSLLTTLSIVQGVATVLWLTLEAGTFPVEYYLSIVEKWQLPLFVTVYACVLSNLLGPVIMVLAKKRRPLDLFHVPMGQWYAYSVLVTYVVGSVKGLLGIKAGWFLTPKFIRGQSGVRPNRQMKMRLMNAGICAVLVLSYSVEGWEFGWRDPFALLLIPAFMLAVRE